MAEDTWSHRGAGKTPDQGPGAPGQGPVQVVQDACVGPQGAPGVGCRPQGGLQGPTGDGAGAVQPGQQRPGPVGGLRVGAAPQVGVTGEGLGRYVDPALTPDLGGQPGGGVGTRAASSDSGAGPQGVGRALRRTT